MLGTPALAAVLGAGVDNRDHEAVRSYIRELCKLGMSVMLCLPGTKQPADCRTVRKRNADDKIAKEEAKAAGRSNWADVESPSGLALATTDHNVIIKKGGYLDEYIRKYSSWKAIEKDENGNYRTDDDGNFLNVTNVSSTPTAKQVTDGDVVISTPVAVNLAIEVGGSRLVVIDCDTTAQKQRFLEWIAGGADLPPTVKSPGQKGRDGDANDPSTWLHSDGGHYYFTVPEGVTLPENLGAVTMSGDDGFAILWNRRYVLIPPSTRPEGEYRVTGVDYPLPMAIQAEIVKAGEARAVKMASYENAHHGDEQIAAPGTDFGSAIDRWADATPWADILEPLGWTLAARVDNCGCDVWTAGPGHASPKSATAHDIGCSLGRYTEVNTPLHIWTFEPGEPFETWIKQHGSSTMSKLQVVALTQYDDNMGAALDGLGLAPQDPVAQSAGIEQNSVAQAAGISSTGLDTPLWGQGAPTVSVEVGKGGPVLPPSPFAPPNTIPDGPPINPAELTVGEPVVVTPTDASGNLLTVHTGTTPQLPVASPFADLSQQAPSSVLGIPDSAIDYVTEQAQVVIANAAVNSDPRSGREIEYAAHRLVCQCGAALDTREPYVMQDADGDWWHQHEGGDHLVLDYPATTDPIIPTQDHQAAVEIWEQGQQLVEPNSPLAQAPALPTQDSDVPFAAPGDTPRPPTPPIDDTPFVIDAGDPDPALLNTGIFGVPVIAPFAHWRDMPAPEYIIDGLIEHGGMSSIIGPPGMGKSSVALDMACHIATGKRWQGRRTLRTKVLYMPGEGLSGAVQRINAWEEAHGTPVGDHLLLADSILKLLASNEAWQAVGEYIIRQGVGFIIFDTFARMSLMMEENSATDVGKGVERLDQIRRHTNAGVLIVHHTAKHSEQGRGSSALNGALDSELLVRAGKWDTAQIADENGHLPGKPIELDTTKQKNSEQLDEPIPLLMVNWEPRNAPIITGPGGTIDPMQADVVLARPVPEPIIETAVRLRRLIEDRHREQGLSRAEAANYLDMDPHTAGRADAPKAWKRKIAEAIDCALSFDLVETLTGTASGGRYIAGSGGIEAARAAYARSIITMSTTQPSGGPQD